MSDDAGMRTVYESVRVAFAEVLRTLPPSTMSSIVPATPD